MLKEGKPHTLWPTVALVLNSIQITIANVILKVRLMVVVFWQRNNFVYAAVNKLYFIVINY